MAAFPAAKLGALVLKQVSKPIANACKNYAKSSPFFRKYICMPPAQLYHWTEVKMKMWILNLGKPVNIPVLNEQQAIELGANLLGEGVIFTIAALILISEYQRSAAKDAKKEAALKAEKEKLVHQLNELYFITQKQSTQINELMRHVYALEDGGAHTPLKLKEIPKDEPPESPPGDAMPLESNQNLVTIHTFKDQEYLIRLALLANSFELTVSDKQVGEEWQGSYDQSYIENLTLKTGNFKSFDVFTKMLNSGLLKSSRVITLSLLSQNDLHSVKTCSPIIKSYFRSNAETNENTRYLIMGYITEFDKTYYPLILEYSGQPDVRSLIATIKRLETELAKTRDEYATYKINSCKHKRVDHLENRVKHLIQENDKLSALLQKKSSTKTTTKVELAKTSTLETALLKLEKSVIVERRNHQKLVDKLQQEKKKMQQEIDTLRRSESALKQQVLSQKSSGIFSMSSRQSPIPRTRQNAISQLQRTNKKSSSRASSKCSQTSTGCDSVKSRSSSANGHVSRSRSVKYNSTQSSDSRASSSIARSENINAKLQASQREYKVIENRIKGLQKRLLSK